jgi:hypothetical protein
MALEEGGRRLRLKPEATILRKWGLRGRDTLFLSQVKPGSGEGDVEIRSSYARLGGG